MSPQVVELGAVHVIAHVIENEPSAPAKAEGPLPLTQVIMVVQYYAGVLSEHEPERKSLGFVFECLQPIDT